MDPTPRPAQRAGAATDASDRAASSTRRRGVRREGAQGVAFVELFFDLVFVFAVTQLTAMTAHDLTVSGVLHALLVGWLIWWAWTQFTWTLNPADTTHDRVRVITLAATGAAFIMAASVPRAWGDEALWFALPYLAVRILGLGLQVLVELERDGADHRAVYRWAGASLVGLVLVLAGALADPGLRNLLWLGAIAADFAAATLAGRSATWDLDPGHVAERHGLIVIIALGESLIVAGAAISGAVISIELILAVGVSVAVACLLWWTYFGWLKEALEHRFARVPPDQVGPVARDAFSFAHFPLIGGIVGFAVAVEETVAHPGDPMSVPVLGALAVGISLYLVAAALALLRLGGPLLRGRLLLLAALLVVLLVAGAFSPPPFLPLAIAAAGLLAIVLLEAIEPPDREALRRHVEG
jgi:low temperature requirement protein LtrA